MQTARNRSSLGQWCRNFCPLSSNLSEETQLECEPPQLPKIRNNSLGISLTIKSKQDRNHKNKSMSCLKPKGSPLGKRQRKIFIEISRRMSNKASIDQQSKEKLSIQMTTFVKENSQAVVSPRLSPALQASLYDSQCSNPKSLMHQSSSKTQQRLSTSKLSSRASLLLVRNDEDDERNEHLKIKSLFQSRRMNSANRISLTNVLNSISEEAQVHDGFGINTPKQNKVSFIKKKHISELLPRSASGKSKFNIQQTGHNKTQSNNNYSTAQTMNQRTRKNSFGSVASYKYPPRNILLSGKALRL